MRGRPILRKWYLDAVADDGRAGICYAARLDAGPLSLAHASLLWSVPGAPPRTCSSWRSHEAPERAGDVLTWRSARLGVEGRWDALARPLARVLRDDATARIEWRCHQPAARVRLALRGQAALEGLGYAEELLVEGDLRRLGLRELAWGRLVAPGHHAAWIDASGTPAFRFLALDGREEADGSVTEARVRLGDAVVELARDRVLRDSRVIPGWFPGLRLLRALVPGSLDPQETKWLARGRLVLPGGAHTEGWVIHESVRWRELR